MQSPISQRSRASDFKELLETKAVFAKGFHERCDWRLRGTVIDHFKNYDYAFQPHNNDE